MPLPILFDTFPNSRTQIANTFFMRYSPLKRLPILISALFLLTSCQARSPKPQVDHSFFHEEEFLETDFDEQPESAKSEESPSPETESDVWDLSDVDVSYVDPTRKLISFTFDDAPSKTLENIFAVFASYNEENPDCKATATVFFNGNLFSNDSFPTLYTALALGFELGNHTHTHADLTTLSQEELQREIDLTDTLLKKADGKTRHLLRAPFGRVNALVKTQATAPLIDWTIDTLDWTGVSEDSIYRAVFENKFSGAIVLMHDGYPHTVDALKRLLPDLKREGYQVVSVSALAKMHNCTFKKGSVYIRARKRA